MRRLGQCSRQSNPWLRRHDFRLCRKRVWPLIHPARVPESLTYRDVVDTEPSQRLAKHHHLIDAVHARPTAARWRL